MGEEENDYATKQSSLLMRRSDHLSTFKLYNEINVTSTSTFEFDCSHYFCGTSLGLQGRQKIKKSKSFGDKYFFSGRRETRFVSGLEQRLRQVLVKSNGIRKTQSAREVNINNSSHFRL